MRFNFNLCPVDNFTVGFWLELYFVLYILTQMIQDKKMLKRRAVFQLNFLME